MITVTFYAPSTLAVHVQNLVKKYGGYFVHNQVGVTHLGLAYTKNAQFKISFNEGSQDGYQMFMHKIDILNQPFV